jgi:hypothetical protein
MTFFRINHGEHGEHGEFGFNHGEGREGGWGKFDGG